MYHKLKKYLNSGSSHQRCSIEKAVLKIFVIFTGKNMCWSLLLIDLQASRPLTFCKIFKKTYFEENPGTIAFAILLLTVNISSWGFVSAPNLIGPL